MGLLSQRAFLISAMKKKDQASFQYRPLIIHFPKRQSIKFINPDVAK